MIQRVGSFYLVKELSRFWLKVKLKLPLVKCIWNEIIIGIFKNAAYERCPLPSHALNWTLPIFGQVMQTGKPLIIRCRAVEVT